MKQYTSLLKKDLFLMGNYLFFIPAITFVLPFFIIGVSRNMPNRRARAC